MDEITLTPAPMNYMSTTVPEQDNIKTLEMNAAAASPSRAQFMTVITKERLRKFDTELNRYKAGKSKLDKRTQGSERWWNGHNEFMERIEEDGGDMDTGFRAKTSWLLNVVQSKHADYIEAYPMPNIRAREESDKAEARMLSSIVPVVLKQNQFINTYDNAGWAKLKFGTGIYKVIYDRTKLHGMGDISVVNRSLLNLFWEPGIKDIQKSKYLFDVEMVDRETLLEEFPELEGKNISTAFMPEKMPTEDHEPSEDKVALIEVYYKKRGKVHYVKYVGDYVIYATEDDNEVMPDKTERDPVTGLMTNVHTKATDGLYDHGLYPYVFDVLFPVENSPAGRGYIDTYANAQMRIDDITQSLTLNTLFNTIPKHFSRSDGQFNEAELLNMKKTIIHYTGTLDETQFRPIPGNPAGAGAITMLTNTVQELKETSGNTDAGNGVASNGVTAASAFAALQQASGKLSRASTLATYTAYERVVYMVIELIRQFYDLPRQFRITGEMGADRFVSFSNEGMKPQWQGIVGSTDMGYRVPEYDIDVVPERHTSYTKIAQNEMAMELYGKGFFLPENSTPSLMCLDMMDFDGKDEIMQKVAMNGTLLQELRQWQQLTLQLASRYEPGMVQGLAEAVTGQAAPMINGAEDGSGIGNAMKAGEGGKEPTQVANARERAASASQPGGSTK